MTKPVFWNHLLIFAFLAFSNARVAPKADEESADLAQRSTTETPPTLEITLPIYSGRPDPKWEVDAQNPNYGDIRNLYNQAAKSGLIHPIEMTPPVLGFKGFFVRPISQEIPALVLGPETKQLQLLILETAPANTVADEDITNVRKEIEKGTLLPAKPEPNVDPDTTEDERCHKRTKFNRGTKMKWGLPIIKQKNNCYNYAVNKVMGHYGTPGLGGGDRSVIDAKRLTPELVIKAALSDNLVLYKANDPNYWGDLPTKLPKGQHFVALFVANDGSDFHWYRRDSDGYWSQKSGVAGVTNKVYYDGEYGNKIDDPRDEDMIHPGDEPGGRKYQYAALFICDKKTVRID